MVHTFFLPIFTAAKDEKYFTVIKCILLNLFQFFNLIYNFRYHWYWFLPLPTFNQMVMAITDTMVTKTTMIITPTMPMSASPQAMTLLLPNPVMALPHPHLHLAMALLHPHLAMALPLPNPAMTLLQQVMIPLQQVCVSTNSAIISNFSYRLGNLRYFGVTRVWRKFYSFFTMKTTYKETGNVSTDHHVSLVPRGTLQIRIWFIRQRFIPTLETNKQHIKRLSRNPFLAIKSWN